MLQPRKEQLDRVGDDREHRLERGADVLRLVPDVGAEERLGDDLERQVHHVLVDVAHLTVAKLRGQTRGMRDHDRRVGLDAIAMKRRLREATLAAPEVAFAREEAVAQDGAQRLMEVAVLLPEPVPRDEHVLDEIRVAHENDLERPDGDAHDVAVLLGCRAEKTERIAHERERVTDDRKARSARGHATEGSAHPASVSAGPGSAVSMITSVVLGYDAILSSVS